MKNIFNHFLRTNKELILQKSLRNCHVQGLHSIVFSEYDSKLTRLFLATREHTLWQNLPEMRDQPLTVAFHPHHCDNVFVGIAGTFINRLIYKSSSDDVASIVLDKYLYHSQIRDGKSGFELLEKRLIFTEYETRRITKHNKFLLRANDIHTVGVEAGTFAAWLIDEDKENPKYQPVCYSNADPNLTLGNNLYQPFSCMEEILKTLADHNLI